ncbi:hypothetical protein [Actinoplanes rectilineatus]|nr:hypothetical protein [Actinoplanes rectilineatus]
MTRVIGVDAYALGWVAVELHDGVFTWALLAATLYDGDSRSHPPIRPPL